MPSISPAKDLKLAPSQTWLVAVDVIDTRPQVRTHFDKEPLAELADSIRANGILQPLLLRPGKKAGRYDLIAGERRLRAARAIGLTHVPAITGAADDHAALRMQIAENIDREDLSVEETAKAVRALYDVEGDIGKVAGILKRSKPWVSKHLAVTMRWNHRAATLLQRGACEDLELLGAFSQYCELLHNYPAVVSYDDVEKVSRQIQAGKVTREDMRRLVGEAKAKLKARNDAAKAKEKAKKENKPGAAPARPKRFNPKTAVRELFSAAWCYHPDDADEDPKPPDMAATLFDEPQRQKMTALLRTAYDKGATAAQAHGDPYKAVLAKFYYRSYDESPLHAAWLAGAFGRPLDLAALVKDVMDASSQRALREAGGDDEGDDDEDLEQDAA